MGKYSDELRAEAVAMLIAENYPDRVGALTAVSEALSIPKATLSRWFKGTSNPPYSKNVTKKKGELSDIYESIARQYLNEVSDPIKAKTTNAKDAVIIAATATDKMRLLRGLPTEIIEVIPQLTTLIEYMKKHNHSPSEVFERMIQRYAST